METDKPGKGGSREGGGQILPDFFIALVILLGYLSYQILKPFLVAIAWAIVLSVLFYPLYAVIQRYVKNSSLASLLVLLLIMGLVAGPLTYLSILLVQELGGFAAYMGSGKFTLVSFLDHPAIRGALGKITLFLQMNPEDLNQAIGDQISRWGMDLIGNIRTGLRNVISATLNFFIMAGPVLSKEFDPIKRIERAEEAWGSSRKHTTIYNFLEVVDGSQEKSLYDTGGRF